MPLSVAGRGRLQLGVANLATSVALLQVVDNWSTNSGIDSRLEARGYISFYCYITFMIITLLEF